MFLLKGNVIYAIFWFGCCWYEFIIVNDGNANVCKAKWETWETLSILEGITLIMKFH